MVAHIAGVPVEESLLPLLSEATRLRQQKVQSDQNRRPTK